MNRQLSQLMELAIPVSNDMPVLARAMSLADELDHHLFDTLYHAVAFEEEATLVTADRRYWTKARKLGNIVELGEWRA